MDNLFMKKKDYEIIARNDILDPADKSIIYKSGTVVETITTNSEGKAISKKLPLGEYSVKETQAPERICIK